MNLEVVVKKIGAVLVAMVLCLGAVAGLTACGGGSGGGSSAAGEAEPAASESEGGSSGGTLKAASLNFPDYLDPALSYSLEGWTGMFNTYIPLLTYKHAEGDEGSELMPGLAKELPRISNGGKTYTLFLRPGLEYSDGTPIKASDFAFAVERMFKLNSAGSAFYTTIVGAEEFAKTKKGGIAGITTDDRSGKIEIELTAPRGTFANELGLMFVAPLPQTTPIEDLSANPPPASGPYMITKSQPGRGWEYERNPAWARSNEQAMPDLPSGYVDKIEVQVNGNASTMVNDVESGAVDWIFQPPPADRYAAVKDKYEGTQFRVEPSLSTFYFWMNTTTAPFDDVEVRQAVNYALDPRAMERIASGQIEGSQQILPDGMPGYRKFELYPHDLERAKELIAEANPSDRSVTVWAPQESPWDELGAYYEGVLNELGFQTKLKVISTEAYSVVYDTSTPNLDTGWFGFLEDYPHPAGFFRFVEAATIAPTGNLNLAQADFPDLDAKLAKLGREPLGPAQEEGYAELDEEFMERAPWAPIGNQTFALFVSDAIDFESVIWNPTYQTDLTSLRFK